MRSLILLALLSISASARDLILVAGQSNAVGFDALASQLPVDERDAQVRFWFRCGDPPPDEFDTTSARQWGPLRVQPRGTPDTSVPKKPRQYGNFAKAEGGFGPEMGLARTLLTQQPSNALAIVKAAFSGTSVAEDWNVAAMDTKAACYRALLDETRTAMKDAGEPLKLRALIWVQGESDATSAHVPEYAARLKAMIEQLRTDLAAPDLIALIGVNTRFGNDKNKHMPAIIAAQQQVAKELKHCQYIDTAGAETLGPNHTHFTSTGTLEVGKRFAQALLKMEAER